MDISLIEAAGHTVKHGMEVLRGFDSRAGHANWEPYVIATPVIGITPLLNVSAAAAQAAEE